MLLDDDWKKRKEKKNFMLTVHFEYGTMRIKILTIILFHLQITTDEQMDNQILKEHSKNKD